MFHDCTDIATFFKGKYILGLLLSYLFYIPSIYSSIIALLWFASLVLISNQKMAPQLFAFLPDKWTVLSWFLQVFLVLAMYNFGIMANLLYT